MTFFKFDDDEVPQDTRDVLAASAILEITEFHLFELAFERWFGLASSQERIERCYAGYMFASRVPFWVRQFCREVLLRGRDDRLDPREFGVLPQVESDSMIRRGIRYGIVVFGLVTTLHLIAILVANY